MERAIYGVTVGTSISPEAMKRKLGLDTEGNVSGLTTAQVEALDGMFKIAAYTADASDAYTAFKNAFGIVGEAEPDEPDEPVIPDEPEPGVSNETKWTNGVAYTFEPIANEYPNKSTGAITNYNNWARSPYLYCAGASVLRGVVKTKSSQFAGTKDNAFYDANLKYVAPIGGTASFAFNSLSNMEPGAYFDVQIPENAAYFIVSGNNTMFPADGEHLIEYVPYE